MHLSTMTQHLALQLEQSKGDYIESWLRGMQKYSDNPFGGEILRLGNTRAFAARNLQEIGLFNQVIGFGPESKEHLHEIIHFYQRHGVKRFRIEVNPYHTSPDLLEHLTAHNFFQSRFETYLYRDTTLDIPVRSTDLTIREIEPTEIDLFADIHVEGFQEALAHVPEKTLRLYRESLRILYRHPGWHLYLAWIDTFPVGMGMLYIQDGIASLAGGATIPKQRRHGSQSALLHHRIHVATQASCSLVVGQTSVDSISQHNMERLGMHTAYTGTGWTPIHAIEEA